MSSAAQIAANRENAAHSSGPTSEAGKAAVSNNRRTHGLTGRLMFLHTEDPEEFAALSESLQAEHRPSNDTELRLVAAIARHYWLLQRALNLQDELLTRPELDHKAFSLYLRYQTTNERAYYRLMHQLQAIRKEQHKQQIGFESQKRAQQLHEAKVRLTNARAAESEIETEVRTSMEAPLPGHIRIPFEDVKDAFRATFREFNDTLEAKLNPSTA